MSSESGLEGSEGQSAYAATKAAVNSFTRSWAKRVRKIKCSGNRGLPQESWREPDYAHLSYEEALAYTRGITIEDLETGYAKTSTVQ